MSFIIEMLNYKKYIQKKLGDKKIIFLNSFRKIILIP